MNKILKAISNASKPTVPYTWDSPYIRLDGAIILHITNTNDGRGLTQLLNAAYNNGRLDVINKLTEELSNANN